MSSRRKKKNQSREETPVAAPEVDAEPSASLGPDTLPPTSEIPVPWDDMPTVNLTGEGLATALAAPPPVTEPPPIEPPAIEPPPIEPATEDGGADVAPAEEPEAGGAADASDDTTLSIADEEPEADVEDAATDPDAGPVEEASRISTAHLRGLLEALIFASDKPMKDREIARLASAPVKQVRLLLAELKTAYEGRGIVLDEVAGGWLFRTNVQYAPFVRELSAEKPVRLTRAQVETLAICAYRQPITRPEIDDIRGVDSGATLKLLLDRDLVRILGKKDEPGRPLLYGTTQQFLEFFGLRSLKDLPTLKEFTELSDESRRVAEAELGEVLPDASPPHTAPAGPEDAPTTHGAPGEDVVQELVAGEDAVGGEGGTQDDTIAPPAEEAHDTLPPPEPEPSQERVEEPVEPGEGGTG